MKDSPPDCCALQCSTVQYSTVTLKGYTRGRKNDYAFNITFSITYH